MMMMNQTKADMVNLYSKKLRSLDELKREKALKKAEASVIFNNPETGDSAFGDFVPAEFKYKHVGKITFACDMNNISEKIPADKLTGIVNRFGSELHVLNVDSKNRHFDPETPYEYARLEEMLHNVKPEYHHVENEDIDAGIQLFVEVNNMDWLVVVPHRHNFFESLFHKSHTKAIVKQAHIPLLALHEVA